MLPIETPIIVNASDNKELSPRGATLLDFDAYYVKPTILTQKVFDQLNPEVPQTANDEAKKSQRSSFRHSISPTSHNFIKKKLKGKKESA